MMSMRAALLSAVLVAGMATAAAGQETTLATGNPSWDSLEDRVDRREDVRDRRH